MTDPISLTEREFLVMEGNHNKKNGVGALAHYLSHTPRGADGRLV